MTVRQRLAVAYMLIILAATLTLVVVVMATRI